MLAWQLCDFQGILTSIAHKPYIFVIFQGGGVRLPVPPSGPAHAFYMQTETLKYSGSAFGAEVAGEAQTE